jgi:hypothetical protein
MNYERFEEKCATAAEVDTDRGQEVLELTLDELSYVAGGINHEKLK